MRSEPRLEQWQEPQQVQTLQEKPDFPHVQHRCQSAWASLLQKLLL